MPAKYGQNDEGRQPEDTPGRPSGSEGDFEGQLYETRADSPSTREGDVEGHAYRFKGGDDEAAREDDVEGHFYRYKRGEETPSDFERETRSTESRASEAEGPVTETDDPQARDVFRIRP